MYYHRTAQSEIEYLLFHKANVKYGALTSWPRWTWSKLGPFDLFVATGIQRPVFLTRVLSISSGNDKVFVGLIFRTRDMMKVFIGNSTSDQGSSVISKTANVTWDTVGPLP